MKPRILCTIIACSFLLSNQTPCQAQAPLPSAPPPEAASVQDQVKLLHDAVRYAQEDLAKRIDDLQWFQRLGDLATVEKISYTSAPARVTNNPTAQGAGNPLIIPAYTLIPKQRPNPPAQLPLLVLVHGGIHGDFKASSYFNITREFLRQGYAIIAPEYRGSTGYGKEFWENIDYGGLENEDVLAGKRWMIENHPEIDPKRVGILGWSHGGMITLMNILHNPADFAVAYAGVPVSDLVARMGYKSQVYRDMFSAKYHIGKTAAEDVEEYRRRSPVYHAAKLQTPLLIQTTTNDEDVNILEVQHLIQALQASGKPFEHRVYTNAPGGHRFITIDTRLAREARNEIHRFLARHLQPPFPPQ